MGGGGIAESKKLNRVGITRVMDAKRGNNFNSHNIL